MAASRFYTLIRKVTRIYICKFLTCKKKSLLHTIKQTEGGNLPIMISAKRHKRNE